MTKTRTEIEAGKCIFCDIANREQVDIVDIEPLNPVVKGHRIIFSSKHSTDFTDHTNITLQVMEKAIEVAKQQGGDYNLITSKGKHATQSVFHLHVHLVPRTKNDKLHLPWTGQGKLSSLDILTELSEKIHGMGFKSSEQSGQFSLHTDGYNQAIDEVVELLKESMAKLQK